MKTSATPKEVTPEQPFSWRPVLLSLYGPSLLFGQGQGAIVTVIALTAHELGASYGLAGLIVTLIGVGLFLGNVPATVLTSAIGERAALIAASIFSAIGISFCLFAPNLWVLSLGVLMQGMSLSVFNLARQAYLLQSVPYRVRARAFSIMGGVHRVGFFVGPFIAAPTMHFFGLEGAYYIGLIAMVATIALCALTPELPVMDGSRQKTDSAIDSAPGAAHDSRSGAKTDSDPSSDPAPARKGAGLWSSLGSMYAHAKNYRRVLLTVGIAVMFLTALRAIRPIALPLWGEHLGVSPAVMALIFSFSSAIDIAAFYPAGKIMDEYGRGWVAVPSVVLLGLSFIFMALGSSVVGFVLAASLMGFGNGISSGIVMTLGADNAPLKGRIEFLGVWRLMSDGGQILGPLMLSGLIMATTLPIGLFSTGLFGFAAGWIFHKEYFQKPKAAGN